MPVRDQAQVDQTRQTVALFRRPEEPGPPVIARLRLAAVVDRPLAEVHGDGARGALEHQRRGVELHDQHAVGDGSLFERIQPHIDAAAIELQQRSQLGTVFVGQPVADLHGDLLIQRGSNGRTGIAVFPGGGIIA